MSRIESGEEKPTLQKVEESKGKLSMGPSFLFRFFQFPDEILS